MFVQKTPPDMKKILVPCDFSKPAIGAFRIALDLAAKTRGTVTLLNILEFPAISNPLMATASGYEHELIRELQSKVRRDYEKLINRYTARGVTVKTEVLPGTVAYMITDYSRRKGMDIIVMGTHGATGLREAVMGSNAEKVVRRASVPVLTVKKYSKRPVRNIVFPNTLETDKQADLVKKVSELQTFFKAKLHVLYVNTPTNFTADDVTHERLKAFASRYKLRNYTLNVYNYPFEEAGILHFANRIKADLVAMGTHGRQGLAHFLNGSLAEDIVNHANFPIWTYAMKS
jgi:nucleotide-binding universal stress UspA family protein